MKYLLIVTKAFVKNADMSFVSREGQRSNRPQLKGAIMYDNYEDACAAELTKQQVIREIESHGCDVCEFFADCGEHDFYDGQAVLDWLGY